MVDRDCTDHFDIKSGDATSSSDGDTEYDCSKTSSDRDFIAPNPEARGASKNEDEDQNLPEDCLVKCNANLISYKVVRRRVVKIAGQPEFSQYLVQEEG
ncbi:hypothetical protein F66182_12876, partial [Fusarium sp. NRRL 66182]